MKRFFKGTSIYIDSRAYILLAAVILIIPFQWLFAWIVAAAIHELGHYLAIRGNGLDVYMIDINWHGAKMHAAPMEGREWICALAGPLTSFCLLVFLRVFPRVAICAFVQGVFNLLPMYPMDGGRVLKTLLQRVMKRSTVDRACDTIGTITVILVMLSCIYATTVLHLGIIPVCVGVVMLMKCILIKIPCKEGKKQVQWCYKKITRYGYDRFITEDPSRGSKTRPIYWWRVQ